LRTARTLSHHLSMRDGDFRVRNNEISRVEGLSDAVFGFAITLLVVSLEVPKTAEEVLHAMRGFFAFAITFSVLFLIWRTQFKFFRRYGLEDNTTVILNGVLLFTVLFFVYPLKFIFTTFVDFLMWKGGIFAGASRPKLGEGVGTLLFMAYGLGWFALFGVFSLMYRHAYAKRDELQLNPLETFDTLEAIFKTTSTMFMGLMIAVMMGVTYLWPAHDAEISYVFVAAIGLVMARIIRHRRGRAKRRAEMAGSGISEIVEA
jgi:hypothetical protein